jgi:hypothetical protein
MGRNTRQIARYARLFAQQANGSRGISSSRLSGLIGSASGPSAAHPHVDSTNRVNGAVSLVQTRSTALAAQQVKVEQQTLVLPEVRTDLYGAISPVGSESVQEGVFVNQDGLRFDDGRYKAFAGERHGGACRHILRMLRRPQGPVTAPDRPLRRGTAKYMPA